VNLFDKPFCQDLMKVLVWFSGKDILAAIEPWCIAKGYQKAVAFRDTLTNYLIEWLRRNPSGSMCDFTRMERVDSLFANVMKTRIVF
jgi:hypothetical protein